MRYSCSGQRRTKNTWYLTWIMTMNYESDNDGYQLEIDSDQEEAIDSSDDEIDIILHGTPEQRRKLRKQFGTQPITEGQEEIIPRFRSTTADAGSSEDEFEKEMTEELDATMKSLEEKYKSTSAAQSIATSQSTAQGQSSKENEPQYYDNEYFDSDSDDEGTREEKKDKKRPVLSNDDLLYDPDADADDQRWIDKQRRLYQPHPMPHQPGQSDQLKRKRGRGQQQQQQQQQRLPNSDAILNCPACMVQLCLDCQRHDKYHNQYRAMFVMNCRINMEQQLRFPQVAERRKKGKKEASEAADCNQSHTAEGSTGDVFNPVTCTQCQTEVGVYDKEEVFHFFNVLASHS